MYEWNMKILNNFWNNCRLVERFIIFGIRILAMSHVRISLPSPCMEITEIHSRSLLSTNTRAKCTIAAAILFGNWNQINYMETVCSEGVDFHAVYIHTQPHCRAAYGTSGFFAVVKWTLTQIYTQPLLFRSLHWQHYFKWFAQRIIAISVSLEF